MLVVLFLNTKPPVFRLGSGVRLRVRVLRQRRLSDGQGHQGVAVLGHRALAEPAH